MKNLFGSRYDYYTNDILKYLFNKLPFLKKTIHFLWTLPSSIWGLYRLRYSKTEELKIVLGSSGRFQKGWIPTNNYFLDILKKSDWEKYFEKSSIDVLLAEHVLEHLTLNEAKTAVQFFFEYLKKDGYLRIAVPDGFNPAKDYQNYVKPGGFGPGSDDHKILYNYKSLCAIFDHDKFRISLLEFFDENGEFHQKNWISEDGLIHRSAKYDSRNVNGKIIYNSIILDAIKL